jgi:HK97 family phage major capsid protein
MSRELATDQGVDVVGFLGRQAGFALGAATRAAFTTGTGSSQPTGLMTSTTSWGGTATTGITGKFVADDLINLAYSVSAPYRAVPGAGFMLNSSSLGTARALKASNAASTVGSLEYMFQVGLQGQADSILGYPIYVNESMASTAVNAKSVAFGDFSRYFIREVNGISVETSTDFAFDYDLITTKVILRTDGLLVDQTGAVKHFVGAAT